MGTSLSTGNIFRAESFKRYRNWPYHALALLIGVIVVVILLLWTFSINNEERRHREAEIANYVQIARNTIDPVVNAVQSGHMSLAEGERQITALVNRMHYTDLFGKNYFFLGSYDGRLFVNPYNPEKIGQNEWLLQDPEGVYIVQEIVKTAQTHPEGGFVRYKYYIPGSDRQVDKVSYVIGIPEVNLFLGTGLYLEKLQSRERLMILSSIGIAVSIIGGFLIPLTFSILQLRRRSEQLEKEMNEKNAAQEAWWKSEERLQLALQATNDGVWDWNIPKDKTYFSPRYTGMLGYSIDEINAMPKGWLSLVHPDDHPPILQAQENCFADPLAIYTVEFRIRTKNGDWLWILSRGKVIERDEAGQAVRMLGTHTNITNLKKAEDEIRISENNLRTIFNNVYDAILLHDSSSGVILEVNEVCLHLFGTTRDQIIGSTVADLSDHEYMKAHPLSELWAQTIAQGFAVFEWDCVRMDNQQHFIADVALRICDWNDRRLVLAVVRDITDRKRTEEALRESEERLRAFIEQTLEAVTIIDEDARVVEWNKANEVLRGLKAEYVLGKHYWDIMEELTHPDRRSPEKLEGVRNLIQSALKNGESPVKEPSTYAFWRADGKLNYLEELVFPIRTAKGWNLGSLSHDVTAQYEAQRMLKAQLDKINSLHVIDTGITNRRPVAEILLIVLEHAVKHLGISHTDILLLNADQELTPAVETGTVPLQENWRCSTGMQEARKGVLVSAHTQRYELSSPYENGSPFKVCIATPLVSAHQTLGIMEAYLTQDFQPDQEWLDYFETLAGQAAIAVETDRMLRNLRENNRELNRAYEDTIIGWSRALELRDEETQGHSGRVTDLATQLASRMGYTEEQLVHFRRGVILHDIGKMGIPDNILLKPGPLDEDEWRIMRQHPLLAYNWLKDIHHLEKAIDVPYAHHERWNGSGYPRGLKGTEIPLSARIFAVVDVFDALILRRPYRMALPVYEAINFLRQNSGVLFDPEVVDLFLQMMEEPNDPIKPIARVDQAYNSQ